MRKAAFAVALTLTAALVPAITHAAPVCPGIRAAEASGVTVTRDILIPMSDGVVLHANVVRPSNVGPNVPMPVLLTQTPYNKNTPALAFQADYLVEHGYTQVVVDVRGTGSSPGDWDSFGEREQLDSGEIVDWLTGPLRPAWSNGNVSTHGTSYGAINQIITAARRPGLIKSTFPIVPMADAYRDITVNGGQVNTSFIPSWLGLVTGLSLIPPLDIAKDPATSLAVIAQHVANVNKFQVPAVLDATLGGDQAYDGAFYRKRSPIEVIDQVTAPTFIVGGWYDLFQRGEPMLFQRLQANGVPSRYLMGPWTHTGQGISSGLPTTGMPCTFEELELRWHDHWLKGLGNDLSDIATVTYRPINAADFRPAAAWPPAPPAFTPLYPSGRSLPGLPGTLLRTAPAGAEDPGTLLQQMPSGPCSKSTTQWTAGNGEGAPCDTDNEINDLTGVMYDLPLPDGAEIAGPIGARLFVSTTVKDAFLSVRLEDVEPNGRSHQLSAGWNVLSFRALDDSRSEIVGGDYVRAYHPFTRDSALPVTPNEIYELWVEVFPVAADIPAGHSLRLAVQTSDQPHLGTTIPQLQNMAGGVVSVYHDAEHPSMVVVPFQNQAS